MKDARPARFRALNYAVTRLGVKEHPPRSNRGAFIDQWNKDAGAPAGSYWCASFVHACFKKAGVKLPGGASVQLIRQAAITAGWVVKRPRRGDLVCFDFGSGKYGAFGDHIGFVEKVLALRWKNGRFSGWISTVEGNTAAQNDLTGSQSNGGGVFRRRRWLRNAEAQFVRVKDDLVL